MKALTSIVSIMLFALCACNQEVSSPIKGAWTVVGWERYSGDSLVWRMPGNLQGDEILIFADKHFNWAGRYKLDTSYIDNFGGGTFILEGKHLIEKILYYGNQDYVGNTIRLMWEIVNDTAVQTWPYDENWELEKDTYSIQKWVELN
jgi:hypothetical protein